MKVSGKNIVLFFVLTPPGSPVVLARPTPTLDYCLFSLRLLLDRRGGRSQRSGQRIKRFDFALSPGIHHRLGLRAV